MALESRFHGPKPAADPLHKLSELNIIPLHRCLSVESSAWSQHCSLKSPGVSGKAACLVVHNGTNVNLLSLVLFQFFFCQGEELCHLVTCSMTKKQAER